MGVKLLLLINCAALVYCSQNTIDPRYDGEWANKCFKALRHEFESTHQQLLNNQQNTGCCSDRQAMQEVKSEIQEIRRIVSDQNQMVENIRNRLDEIDTKSELQSIRRLLMSLNQSPVRGESHTRRRLKSEIDEIREVVAEQHNGSRNDSGNECPPGFDYASDVGSCYKAIFERMTWDAATETCRQLMPGSHLATITSQAENDAIARYLQSKARGIRNKCTRVNYVPWPQAKDLIWIGAQTKNPSNCSDPYVWKPLEGVEIPLDYFNWIPNNPDCYGAAENCIQMVTGINYKWNDSNCTWLSCALCELPVHV